MWERRRQEWKTGNVTTSDLPSSTLHYKTSSSLVQKCSMSWDMRVQPSSAVSGHGVCNLPWQVGCKAQSLGDYHGVTDTE